MALTILLRVSKLDNMRGKLNLLSFCLATFLCSAVNAATINVGPGQMYTTIQAGINAANNGDTVNVFPGTYYENINFNGKLITVTSTSGAANTIIDGSQGASPAVTIPAASAGPSKNISPPQLVGFTIRNGGVEPSSAPTGGIYIYENGPVITNNVITHNHCSGIYSDDGEPTIQNNEIDTTLDSNGDCFPGGGSGIYIGGQLGHTGGTNTYVNVTGNTIQNNTQGGQEGIGAGGITALQGGPISGNTLRNNATAGYGGAIYIANSNTAVSQNLIYDNTAACGGGAIATRRTSLDGGTLLIVNNTIVDNIVSGTCNSASAANASQIFYGDTGSEDYATATVNNIVSGNTLLPSVACGLAASAATTVYVKALLFDHNLILNSGGGRFDSSCIDPTGTYGNISNSPEFVNPSAYNFNLQSSSPAIDAGNTSEINLEQDDASTVINTATDFAGNPRVVDGTGLGYAVVDMGAYEDAGTQDTDQTALTLAPSAGIGQINYVYVDDGGTTVNLTSTAFFQNAGSMGCAGPIAFYEDGGDIGSANLLPGTATATLNGVFLSPGVHHFDASYQGQPPCSPAEAVQIVFIVSNYTPTMTLTSSQNPALQGQPVTFTATISSADPKQGGPIVLTDNGTPLATLTPNANGTAFYITSSLALGTHQILASYAGDSTHSPTNAEITQSIVSSFTLTADPPSITIETQHHESMQLILTSNGFAGQISLSCGAPLPAYVTCELPGTVSLGAGQTLPVTLTMDTDALLNFYADAQPQTQCPRLERIVLAIMLPMTLAGLVRRRRLLHGLLLTISLATITSGLSACGDKLPDHTPPGTYLIPVTATGTAAGGWLTSQAVQITLTVTP